MPRKNYETAVFLNRALYLRDQRSLQVAALYLSRNKIQIDLAIRVLCSKKYRRPSW
jgi:hypothetical protein